MRLSRKHTRSRPGESRRRARLFYQQIFDEMDREGQQEQCLALAIDDEELHFNRDLHDTFGAFHLDALTAFPTGAGRR
jgi:hypothetical protein